MTDKELSDFIEHGSNHFMEFALVFGDGWAGQAIQIAKELRTRQRESRIDKMINQQKKEWVGLTDEEIQDAGRYSYCRGGTSEKLYHIMWNSQPSASIGWCREELVAFAQVVEAKYREKNT